MPLTISEIRSKYPQYGDMTDAQLAAALHQKYYSDMPADEFASKIGIQMDDQTKDAIKSGMSWGDVVKGAVSNIPSSAGQFAENVAQPFMHPIETAQNVGNIGKGVLQKLGLMSGKDAEPYADAVGKYFVDRYGSEDAIKNAIAKDPVGVLADVSTVLTGGGELAARGPGLVGEIGNVAKTAGRITNPVSAVSPIARGAGNLAADVAGVTTGAGGEAIKTAVSAGQQGGQAGKAFLDSMTGAEPVENVVSEARGAVANLRQVRGDLYRQEMQKLGANTTVLKFNDIDAAVNNTVKKFKGVSISPSVEAIQGNIKAAVEDWKQLDPKQFHTPEGLDALKQQIGDIRDNTQPNTPQRLAADKVYNAVKDTIVKQAPEYAKIMKGYEEASTQIKEIEKTLSLNPKASIDTALRKITSALRDDVNTNYGRRQELVAFLARSGATHLLEKIAGQSLKAVMPRGIARLAVSGEGAGALGAIAAGHPAVAAGLMGSLVGHSPFVVGSAAYGLGAAQRLPLRQLMLGARALPSGSQ